LQEEWNKERVYQLLLSSIKWICGKENRKIVEMDWSMLKTKYLRNEFWSEAMHIVVYTLNRCPTRAVLNLTAEEYWLGYKPSVIFYNTLGLVYIFDSYT
jgi:hypothetical protein